MTVTEDDLDWWAIFDRIDLVTAERGLPSSEAQKARSSERGLHEFVLSHRLSYDWLILGDIRGLLQNRRG
jgi:hypothetical protein